MKFVYITYSSLST